MEDFMDHYLSDLIRKEDHDVSANISKGNRSALPNIENYLNIKNEEEVSDFFNPAFRVRISHKVCTSMNAIMGLAQILNHNEITNDERKLYTETICKETEHLLLDFNWMLDILTTKSTIYRSCG